MSGELLWLLAALLAIAFALSLAGSLREKKAWDVVKHEQRKQEAWALFYGGYSLTREQWECISPLTRDFLIARGRADLIPMLGEEMDSEE